MILDSKCSEKVVQAFNNLGSYATLFEEEPFMDKHINDLYKKYALNWKYKDKDDRPFNYRQYCHSNYITFSFHVSVMVRLFLQGVPPRMLRFEIYSVNNDLSKDYQQAYNIYCSTNNVKLPGDPSYSNIRKDILFHTPKCSFEFIKDLDQFSSLYQYSTPKGRFAHIKSLLLSPRGEKVRVEKQLLKSLFSRKELVTNISIFRNLKGVTIDKVDYQGPHTNQNGFFSFDCSRSAEVNTNAYDFLKTYFCFDHTGNPRLKATTQTESSPKSSIHDKSSTSTPRICGLDSLPYYIRITFADFLAQKLEMLDITAFDARSTTVLESNGISLEMDELQVAERNTSYELNLKGLESKINSLVESILELQRTNQGMSDPDEVEKLSQELMGTFIHEASKLIPGKGQVKQQPLRLRLYTRSSHYLNRYYTIIFIRDWFRKHMC